MITDAVRRFVGFGQTKSDIAIFIREDDWKERFGADADSVMKRTQEMSFLMYLY